MGYAFVTERLEPDEDIVIAMCSRCNGEIYDGEEYGVDYDGSKIICCDCINDEFTELPLFARYQIMGMEIKKGMHCGHY